ncbi:hypothetical protein D3C80_729800 [compost metagenome]
MNETLIIWAGYGKIDVREFFCEGDYVRMIERRYVEAMRRLRIEAIFLRALKAPFPMIPRAKATSTRAVDLPLRISSRMD